MNNKNGLTVQPAKERAIVLKALFRGDRVLEDPFDEITALCETAGAVVIDTVSQNLERIHAATYLGKGKIEEVARRVEELQLDLVVTDNDLSPAQERNLEKFFRCKVVDRSQLILDIFARRASTQQAKLQVELAQLQYTFPRLKRMWTHLSRYEGGIGTRGPGETQLETDKRLMQRRIQKLTCKLQEIEERKEVSLRHRKNDLVIALVGYTNVGKSTLLNRLTGSREFVEDKLFATLDTRTRRWEVDKNRHVLLNDTVGFIRELPHHLVASFHATLAETQHADLLFHVIDASAPQVREQIRAVEEVLREIRCDQKPVWFLLNKFDRLAPDRQVEARGLESMAPPGTPVFSISAATGQGLSALRQAVAAHLGRADEKLSLLVPHERGDVLAFINRCGKVLSQVVLAEGTRLEVEMPPPTVEKLRRMLPGGRLPVFSPAS